MNKYRIDPIIEPYLHELLDDVVYHYIAKDDWLRYCDVFRGALGAAFHLGYVAVPGLVFLLDFLIWLENKTVFDEEHDDMYQYFYNGFIKDLGA